MLDNLAIILLMLAAVGVGVVLAFLTLPGVWLMLAAAVAIELLFPTHKVFHPATLITLVIIAVLGEVIEVLASAVGAGKAGGSKKSAAFSVVGAMLGAVLGTFLIPVPVVGTVAGASLGAGLLAMLSTRIIDRKDWDQSMEVAKGAAVGRLAATFVKISIAMLVGGVLVWSAVYP
jgi:uncharacterized protein YqgC (DUF456 family)